MVAEHGPDELILACTGDIELCSSCTNSDTLDFDRDWRAHIRSDLHWYWACAQRCRWSESKDEVNHLAVSVSRALPFILTQAVRL